MQALLEPLAAVSSSVLWAAFAFVLGLAFLRLTPALASRLQGAREADSDPDLRRAVALRLEEKLVDLRAALTDFRAETKIDFKRLGDQINGTRTKVQDHETRLTVAEKEILHFASRLMEHVKEPNGMRGGRTEPEGDA